MADVFISYSSEDRERTEQLVAELEKNGINCWMDRNNIAAGSYFGEEVPEAILSCPIFMLLLSENSQKSKYVLMELDWATSHDKDIIPVVISDCEIVPKFGFLLQNKQRYHAFNDTPLISKKMISHIETLLSNPAIHPSSTKSIVDLALEHGIKCPGCGSTEYIERHDLLDSLSNTTIPQISLSTIIFPCLFIAAIITSSLIVLTDTVYPNLLQEIEQIRYENIALEEVQSKVQTATDILKVAIKPVKYLANLSTTLFLSFLTWMFIVLDPKPIHRLRKSNRIRRGIEVYKLKCCICDKKFKKTINLTNKYHKKKPPKTHDPS